MTLRYSNEAISYDITIAPGALAHAGELFALERKVLVVTGEGVPRQYAEAVLAQCGEGHLLVIPEGESNKTLNSVELILGALLEHGFTRGDALVAVGGGVVGDTVGFAAACYMRGIDWYNVPTTLLSQVDSSVGGKTGVNLHGVKNIVGAFHHPCGVIIDTRTLDTLSPRLFSEGLAEVIKMAATSDAALFKTLEQTNDIRSILPDIVTSALRIKISVVESDPTEHGLRAVLNFGHTIGHAIEGASGACGTPVPGYLRPQSGLIPPTSLRSWAPPSNVSEGGHGSREQLVPSGCAAAGCILEARRADSGGVGGYAPRPLGVAEGRGIVVSSEAALAVVGEASPDAEFYHGEAVAVGMLYMASGEAKERIERVLKKYGLPTEDGFGVEELMEFAAHDKKKREGKVKLVKVDEIGSFRFEEAGPEELRSIIQARKI